MISLSDRQIEHILHVARPLAVAERRLFAAALFEELLNRRDDLGDGALGRLLRELQQKHFQPPRETEDSRTSCHSRHGPRPRV